MKKTKTQRGITLIALIITIVVLMILAVVTINAVRDGGTITHAQNAVDRYEIAKQNEQDILDSYLSKIEYTLLPEELKTCFLGKSRNDIFDDTNNVFKGEAQKLGVEFLNLGQNEDFTKEYIYAKYNGAAYRISDDFISLKIEEIKKIYEPQGNEGKTVKYDSNGDGTKEEWTVITDRNGKLEIVSRDAIGELTLGDEDTNVTVTDDLNGNGVVSDYVDIAIASYNNAINTINTYCRTLVTSTDNLGVRSLGASTDTALRFSSEKFNSWFKGTAGVKAGDINYEEDLVKLSYFGIASASSDYWFASRYTDSLSATNMINFCIVAIYSDGIIGIDPLWYLVNGGTNGYSVEYAVRPVVINPTNIEYVD